MILTQTFIQYLEMNGLLPVGDPQTIKGHIIQYYMDEDGITQKPIIVSIEYMAYETAHFICRQFNIVFHKDLISQLS